MVLPASFRSNSVHQSLNGALVFEVTRTSVSLRGLVDHILSPGDNFFRRSVERSLYIEDLLYTKSACLLRINALDSLAGLKDVDIPC